MGNEVFEKASSNGDNTKTLPDSTGYNSEKDVRPNEHPPGWNQD